MAQLSWRDQQLVAYNQQLVAYNMMTGRGTSSLVGLKPPATKPQSSAKPKFKKGDIVIGNGNSNGYTYTTEGTKWEVTSCDGPGVTLKWVKGLSPDPDPVIPFSGGLITGSVEAFDLYVAPRPVPKVGFDSVILPDHKKQQIMAAIEQIKHTELIFEKWGFSEVFEKGTAVSMLFYGPPGTGKTLMAQAIADTLSYKLKLIDTAMIESSEPGQAERNLKSIFGDTKDDTLLLFDECDSLIGERANMGTILAAQVNALLTGLETFKGIAIFTTNRLGTLDEALNRRLSLKLEFEMPDAHHRKLIWQRMFPKKAPLAKDIDWDALAAVEVAGGYVKNVVLRSARMAAVGAKIITTDILLEALQLEVEALLAFEEAKRKTPRLPRQVGYDIRKGGA